MHMAQLRQDQHEFEERDTIIIVVGPDDAHAFRSYWKRNDLGFTGLPDPQHAVLDLFGQAVNLIKLGRMPAQVIVDKNGVVRYAHYGHSMSDIPENSELLSLIEKINQPSEST